MDPRRLIATLLFGSLAGCAAASEGVVAPAEAPAPEVVEPAPDTTPPPPPVEPELSLEERWSAPFAVRSSGSVPPRAPRAAAVRLRPDTALQVAARAEPPADTAAKPAAPPAPARKAPAPRAEEPAKAAPRTHRVAPGETFYGIARRYAVGVAALRDANPQVDPERLPAGAVLRIPAGGAPAGEPEARTHVVVQGDTLYGIARRYGVRPEEIRAANRMESDVVKIGQKLVIPTGG